MNHSTRLLVASASVKPLLQEAIRRWEATGVNIAALRGVTLRVAPLDEEILAEIDGSTIWLDDNAAGWGWFVDKTPKDDVELTQPGIQGEQNRMDLVITLIHERGHVLCRDHNTPVTAPS